MTRWARGHKKKHIDASSWDELKRPTQNGVSKKIKGKSQYFTLVRYFLFGVELSK